MTDHYIYTDTTPYGRVFSADKQYDVLPEKEGHTFSTLDEIADRLVYGSYSMNSDPDDTDFLVDAVQVFKLVPVPLDELRSLVRKKLKAVQQEAMTYSYYKFRVSTQDGRLTNHITVRVADSVESLDNFLWDITDGQLIIQRHEISEQTAKVELEYMQEYLRYCERNSGPARSDYPILQKALVTFND